MAEAKQTSQLSPEAMMRVFKRWFEQDRSHSSSWRKQAKEDYDFVAGDGQWSMEDRSKLQEEGRAPITFNRTLTLIEAVSGIEINGRHETTFVARGNAPGAVQKNELLSGASRWMDDESDAPRHQSRAFQDSVKVGMGWTEAALSYDDEADGAYVEKRIDPLEMWWDHKARDANLADAKRIWHIRSDIDIDDARAMFPGVDDEDLNADWCDVRGTDPGRSKEEKRKRDGGEEEIDDGTVTIARIQWIEKEPYYKALLNGESVELSHDKLKQINGRLKQQGMPPIRAVKMMRKVYKQAFIGARVLSEDLEAPCPHFTFNCITGKVHENKGTWYGLVHLVRDPQRWANKWLTQSLHILNTTARGGILAETDAFEDQRDAEANYARPDAIVWMKKEALQKGKVQPKPGQGLPQGHIELMQFAISSIRDASGINLEILGLREATQPGVLEAQRKQAGMTILATLFDSLAGFRKRVGKVRLYFLQTYLADGRLIRLAGPGGEQYVPLVQDKVAGRYDVIVGDAPTSPNMREQTWSQLQPMLVMFKDAIPPQLMLELMEYSPLPSAVTERIKRAVQEQQQQAEQDPEAKARKQLAMRGEVAKVEEVEAKAAKLRAETDSIPLDDAIKVADAEHERMAPKLRPQRAPQRVPS